jgi:hypothetical protein
VAQCRPKLEAILFYVAPVTRHGATQKSLFVYIKETFSQRVKNCIFKIVVLRVARVYIFIPSIQSGCILEGFGREKRWYIIRPLRIFYSHLVHLGPGGILCGHLVYFARLGML